MFNCSCLKFLFNLYLLSFCFTFAFNLSFFDDSPFYNPIIQSTFSFLTIFLAVTLLHFFLSFPIISLYLGNLAGYFLTFQPVLLHSSLKVQCWTTLCVKIPIFYQNFLHHKLCPLHNFFFSICTSQKRLEQFFPYSLAG